jgi:hypothetical protein
MTGRKSLGEVRAELEKALPEGPTGDGEVPESLRRFLSSGQPANPPQCTSAARLPAYPDTSGPSPLDEDAGTRDWGVFARRLVLIVSVCGALAVVLFFLAVAFSYGQILLTFER